MTAVILPDDLLLIARWDSEESTQITLQDFVIAGRSIIPFWTDESSFKAQISGSGFEGEAVWIKRPFLHEILLGSEILMLNPGGVNPVEFSKADLLA